MGSNTERAGVWRRRAVRLAAAAAWGGVGALGAAVLFAEVYRPDPAHAGWLETRLVFLALLIQTFTFHAGIAVAAGLALALCLRRWRLGVALALAGLTMLGPAAWSGGGRGGGGRSAEDLVVMSANVLYVNEDPAAFIERVLELDPDVVLIQEYRRWWSEEINGALSERYPHRVEAPGTGAQGEAVLSKLPFVGEPALAFPGWAWDNPMIRFTIDHGGSRVEIVCVHLWAPLSWRAVREQRRQAEVVGAWVEDRMTERDAPDALILAGDFNAPYRTNHLRELRAAGLREAHDAIGSGRGATWRPRRSWLSWAPGIRLDHVMYRGGAACTGSGTLGPIGSDHLPVWASFRVGAGVE